MMKRRRFKQDNILEVRLAKEIIRLREEAKLASPGIERDRLLRRVRQAEIASQMSEWLRSPGLRPPV